MATGKNKILVYADWQHLFNKLTDDEAGKLIKHFFAFVNTNEGEDEPVPADRITDISFEPIKLQLKRDLKAWKEKIEVRAEAGSAGGKKSGEIRKQKTDEGSKMKQNEANGNFALKNEANEAVKVNVKDNVNVKDIETHKSARDASEFNFDFVEEHLRIPFMTWFYYRQKVKPFKVQVSVESCYSELKQLSGNSALEAIKIVQYSASCSYTSLCKKDEKNNKFATMSTEGVKAAATKGVPDT